MHSQNTKAELHRLLQARNEYPEKIAEIDAQIHTIFAETHAILVLDMSGFSRLTIRHGIIHFLAMIHRLSAIATPLVEQHQGTVIKQEADNLFAVFPEVVLAVNAGLDILKSLATVNSGLPDAMDLYASIGIGYGEVLLVAGEDLYGNEMNLASKLGEDLARSNEILLTELAFQQLQSTTWTCEAIELSVSGLELTAYQVQFSK
ncbi:MAG: adenylate/guanylate cyclase domain-containing protein [Trichocoleus desertorum ATA4-8-CV12]|jgi:class 3 adenylate cyclase|nr:adenylate/guanylate cyclase domain-containing protein [Trichocoleus desertorum ATA4-8-CV12]